MIVKKDCMISELNGKKVFAMSDMHGDVEVLLKFLKEIGIKINRHAKNIHELVSWGNIKDTIVIFCGDMIDRKRHTINKDGEDIDNQTPKILFSNNKYYTILGTNGEIPMEEFIIVNILIELHKTCGSNRIIVLVGNHELSLLEKRGYIDTISDLSAYSDYILSKKVWFHKGYPDRNKSITSVKCKRNITIDGGYKYYRRSLHKAFYQLRHCMYMFFIIGNTIFSHAGFTKNTVKLINSLNIDPNQSVRQLSDPNTDKESLGNKSFLRKFKSLFDERYSFEELSSVEKGIDMSSLGLDVVVKNEVLGHNCGNSIDYSKLVRHNIYMLDMCPSRAFRRVRSNGGHVLNGNILYLSMDENNSISIHCIYRQDNLNGGDTYDLDEKNTHVTNEKNTHVTNEKNIYDSCSELIREEREPNNSTTMPHLDIQRGLYVVGDIDTFNGHTYYKSRFGKEVVEYDKLLKTFMSEIK